MSDNQGNVDFSEQPQTGEFLKWIGGQRGWVTDTPPTFWNGTVNTTSTIQRDGNVKLGDSGTSTTGKLHISESHSSVSLHTVGDAKKTHRISAWFDNPHNDSDTKGNFAIMARATTPYTQPGHFNGAVVGRIRDSADDSIMVQGELGKAQVWSSTDQGTNRWLSSVMGLVNAYRGNEWIGGFNGNAAAVRGYVSKNYDVNGDPYDNIYAGIFDGAKTMIQEMVSPGGDYAEWIEKEESTRPGDLIGINLENGKARRYRRGDLLIGIHSENPAIIGNQIDNDMKDTHCMVALVGQVPVDRDQVDISGRIVKTKDGKMVGVLLKNDKVLLVRQM
jgi:hypothetical protein